MVVSLLLGLETATHMWVIGIYAELYSYCYFRGYSLCMRVILPEKFHWQRSTFSDADCAMN